jgi:serine/threonine-protein kinase
MTADYNPTAVVYGRSPVRSAVIDRTIGPYRVVAKLGEGGMGEVYRARDTKLGRDVALKVLPASFVGDPDRLMRFEREARTLASLNHPHIAQIHGVEDTGEVKALVMELVEGETLADRLTRGPMPIDEALAVARQVAGALESAHDAGIVHRDLKPANIKVRGDGMVKVLDFGLAKPVGAAPATASAGPTVTSPAITMQGVILGTAAYMAPEQAKGKAVDKRTDIWAFGCLLFEMLTGRRVFDGDDITETLTSVLRDAPRWNALPAATPDSVRRTLARCLERDPTRRLRDIGDVELDVSGSPVERPESPTPVAAGTTIVRSAAWTAVGALLAAVTFAVTSNREADSAPPVTRVTLTPPSDTPLRINDTVPDLALAADGRRLAYLSPRRDPDGSRISAGQINVRDLHTFEPSALTDSGQNPQGAFFSPDGGWIGFQTSIGASVTPVLAKAPVGGGPLVVLCDLGNLGQLNGASWGANGQIIFATSRRASGLQAIADTGGTPREITTPDRSSGEADHVWPESLPDGRGTIFAIARDNGSFDIAVLPAEETTWRVIVRGGSAPRYLSSGYLVYAARGTIYGVGFDLPSLTVTTEPVSLVEGVLAKDSGAANFAVSANGTLTYVAGAPRERHYRLVWLNRDGTITALPLEARAYRAARLSPDGRRIVAAVDERNTSSLWLYDLTSDSFTRLTARDESVGFPVWNRDGTRLAFWSETQKGIYTMAADGSNRSDMLMRSDGGTLYPNDWSGDGRQLLVLRETPQLDLQILSLAPPHAFKPFSSGRGAQVEARYSPDGRWVTHTVFDGSVPEVVVGPATAGERQWPVASPGRYPTWTARGAEIVFIESRALHRVAIDAKTGLPVGRSSKLLDLPERLTNQGAFDSSADGTRFLLLERVDDQASPAEIRLVLSWQEEVRARMANAGRAMTP